MVAIHVPRPSDDWAPSPAPGVRPRPRPPVPVGPLVRRLPDRATRFRRRRLAVLVTLVVAVALAVGAARLVTGLASIGASSGPRSVEAPGGAGPAPVAGVDYVVRPGDTLWSIATRIAPDDDPRVVVDALDAANGGVDLQVGDRLELDLG